MLAEIKDRTLSHALRIILGPFIDRYGKLDDIDINLRTKSIACTVHLVGEAEPLAVQVAQYEVITENGERYFVVREITTSKEWITLLVQDHLTGRQFAIPKMAAVPLKMAGMI